MNIPIIDEKTHTSVPKETSSVASSTTSDRLNQLLALPDTAAPAATLAGHGASSVPQNEPSRVLLKDSDLWGSWHLNGTQLPLRSGGLFCAETVR